jgi:hypothetical protein
LRTYGRLQNKDGSFQRNADGSFVWQVIETDANDQNGYVWLTTLCQCLQLILGESPFYAQYGIPSTQSVLTQVYPDYYVQITQQQFQQYFASLVIYRATAQPDSSGQTNPVYYITAVLLNGTVINRTVPI